MEFVIVAGHPGKCDECRRLGGEALIDDASQGFLDARGQAFEIFDPAVMKLGVPADNHAEIEWFSRRKAFAVFDRLFYALSAEGIIQFAENALKHRHERPPCCVSMSCLECERT